MSVPQPSLSLIKEAASVASALSEAQVSLLADKLLSGEMPLSATALLVQHLLPFSASEARRVAMVLRSWHKNGSSEETLAVALLGAQNAYTRARSDMPSVKLVWTGPISLPGSTQSTENTLLNMIDKGKQEIVIVGYVLTEAASAIIERLAMAQKRGVKIVWIGNLMEEKVPLLRVCWPANQQLPNLYTRRLSGEDPMSALHAKVVIVDQRSMLVTSANLSYHGLRGNIEIGVEVEGPIVLDASTLLNKLIAEGVCVRVQEHELL